MNKSKAFSASSLVSACQMLWIAFFGLWLRQLWQAIEHVHRLVLPATLVAGLGVDLIHGGPEPHGSVPDGQLGHVHALDF